MLLSKELLRYLLTAGQKQGRHRTPGCYQLLTALTKYSPPLGLTRFEVLTSTSKVIAHLPQEIAFACDE